MKRIRSFCAALRRDQRGLSTVEYAIILCLIAAFAVGTWQSFGEKVEKSLGESTRKIDEKIN
jgi:Flp pilus assembly pilin Flp